MLQPIVNSWLASLLQPAVPRVPPSGTTQVAPFALFGASGRDDFPAVKANSWESVSCPSVQNECKPVTQIRALIPNVPPSARPPQENNITVSPAARRGSKFKQPWVFFSVVSASLTRSKIRRQILPLY